MSRPANPSPCEKAAAIADAAADVIEHGGGVAWIRDGWSRWDETRNEEYGWCAWGAVRHLMTATGCYADVGVFDVLCEATGGSAPIVKINDEQGREAAIRALREAARKLRRKGAKRG